MREPEKKLWTKNYLLIMLINMFTNIIYFALSATIPLYVIYLGSSNSIAGLTTTIYSIAALLTRPFWGYASDHKSRRAVIIAGAVIFIAASLLYNEFIIISILIIIRIINGIGFSALTTASGAAIADVLPSGRISEGIGFYGMASTIGTAVGPAIAIFLVNSYGYSILFMFVLLVSILDLIFALMINYEKKNEMFVIGNGKNENNKTIGNKMNIRNIFEKTSIRPSYILFLYALSSASVIAFITLLGTARGIGNIGIFFTVYAIAVFVTRLFIGRLTDQYGVTRILIFGLLVMLISFILIATAGNLNILIIAAVLFGLGSGAVYTIINIIIIRLCPADRRGLANCTMLAALDIGMAVGAMVWGVISEKAGFATVYYMCAGVILIAVLSYYLLLYKKA